MSTLTFELIAKSAIEGSPILSDEMVAQYLLNKDYRPLQAYLYRIAAYAVDEIRQREEFKRGEEDYIDALQECVTVFPAVLSAFLRDRSKLSTYAQLAFRRVAVRYLDLQARGGMAGESGRWADECPPIISLEDLNPGEDDDGNESEDTWDDATAHPDGPTAGLRDPAREVLAAESVLRAQKYVNNTKLPKDVAAQLREEVGKS